MEHGEWRSLVVGDEVAKKHRDGNIKDLIDLDQEFEFCVKYRRRPQKGLSKEVK